MAARLHAPEHPPAPRPEGDRGCTASPGARAGQRSTFNYRNRVFKHNNSLKGDGRRDLERRI